STTPGPMPIPGPGQPALPPNIPEGSGGVTLRIDPEDEPHWLTRKFAELFKDYLARRGSDNDFLGLRGSFKTPAWLKYDPDNPGFLANKFRDFGRDYLPDLKSLPFESQ